MEKGLNSREVGHDNGVFVKDLGGDHVQINETKEERSRFEPSQSAATKLHHVQAIPKGSDDKEVDLSCGIWKLRTNVFGKRFANLYMFSILVGLTACFTSMMQSVFQTHVTSLQRQFGIDSTKTGLFETASKIGSVCTVLFAGHFAKKLHIPMLIGFAGVIQGIVLMVPAFMQFADPYTLPIISSNKHGSNGTNETNRVDENKKYWCNTDSQNSSSGGQQQNSSSSFQTNQAAFVIIVVMQAIRGVTDSFHAGFLPSLYMDDNMLNKRAMGAILGLNSVIGGIGSPIGSQINAYLSKVPIDLKHTDIHPKDGRFVAAWWLAFLIFGAGTLVFSFPVMLFPKKLISKRQQEESLKNAMVSFTIGDTMDDNSSKEDITHNTVEKSPSTGTKIENTPKPDRKHRKLSLTPTISNLSGVLDMTSNYIRRSSLLPPIEGPSVRRISIDGTMIFEQPIKPKDSSKEEDPIQGSTSMEDLIRDLPRAFMRVFRRPVFILIIINIFILSIPTNGIALFRSAYITNEYNVSMADVATMLGWTNIAGQLLGTFISGFLAKRVKTKIGYVYINIACMIVSNCITPIFIIFGCDNETIYGFDGNYGMPTNMTDICSCANTRTLISCGADGNNYLSPCHAGCRSSEGQLFKPCSGLLSDNSQNMTLTTGLCPTDCYSNFILYVVLHAVQIMVLSMSTIPIRLLIMRMVDPKDRGFASSFFIFCYTLVAIPSTNIFGKVIDDTCLIWDGSHCALYDRDKIRYLISGVDIGVSVATLIFVIFTMLFFRKEEKEAKRKLQQEKNDKKKDNEIIVKL